MVAIQPLVTSNVPLICEPPANRFLLRAKNDKLFEPQTQTDEFVVSELYSQDPEDEVISVATEQGHKGNHMTSIDV